MGMWASSQSWLIRLKQERMSPSKIHRAPPFRANTVWHWSMASAVDRSFLNP